MTAHQTMLRFIATRDHLLMRRVNKWPAPKWIRLWAIAATRAGDGWLWYVTGLGILLFGGDARLTAIASAGSAALVGIGLFKSLKRLSGRRRPCESNRTAGRNCCLPISFPFPPATPLRRLPYRFRWQNFIPCSILPCCFALRASQFPGFCLACIF